MKDKIGFNIVFTILAFPVGLALFRDLTFKLLHLEKQH